MLSSGYFYKDFQRDQALIFGTISDHMG